MNDPKSAIDAILETEKEISGITIYPITLQRYALLETVESPFLNADISFSMMNVIPSLYVMTHDAKELKVYNTKNIDKLIEEASEWSESINIKDLSKLIKEISDKIGELFKVAPDSSDEKKTAAPITG